MHLGPSLVKTASGAASFFEDIFDAVLGFCNFLGFLHYTQLLDNTEIILFGAINENFRYKYR